MEMDSSPARKEEVEMEREGERGVLPKKETEGGAVVIVDGLFWMCLLEMEMEMALDVCGFQEEERRGGRRI